MSGLTDKVKEDEYETEVMRLQRETDEFTERLEHERKRYAIVNEEYN